MGDRITDERLRDLERALVAISEPYRYEPTTSLPALSPQMQAALDAEAQMVAMVLKRAREVEAELQAARAEVERLRGMLALLCGAVEHSAPGYGVYEDWGDICDGDLLALRERMIEAKALLAKHKETNQ